MPGGMLFGSDGTCTIDGTFAPMLKYDATKVPAMLFCFALVMVPWA